MSGLPGHLGGRDRALPLPLPFEALLPTLPPPPPAAGPTISHLAALAAPRWELHLVFSPPEMPRQALLDHLPMAGQLGGLAREALAV